MTVFEFVIAAVLIVLAGVLLTATVTAFFFVFVELPRRGIQYLWTLLTGSKPRNLRSLNASTFVITGFLGSVILAVNYSVQHGENTILGAIGFVNLLVALITGWQALSNEQVEERAVHHYVCPACKRELHLSDLPLEGGFKCKFCKTPLFIKWGSEGYAYIGIDFSANRRVDKPEE